MDEVTKPATHTALAAIEAAAGLAKVGHGREFAVNWAGGVPAAVEGVAGLLRRVFVLEARVHVSNEMIVVVVAHDYFLQFAILAHLAPKVLVEGVKVVLQLHGVHLVLGVVRGVLVEVGEEDGLGVGRLDVLSRAAVAMSARADFVVEGAVDLVLFCAKDGG